MSLKRSVFSRLRDSLDGQSLAEKIWELTELLDTLALWTTEIFQKSREEVIARQQQEMLELSTPVVKGAARHWSPASGRAAMLPAKALKCRYRAS